MNHLKGEPDIHLLVFIKPGESAISRAGVENDNCPGERPVLQGGCQSRQGCREEGQAIEGVYDRNQLHFDHWCTHLPGDKIRLLL